MIIILLAFFTIVGLSLGYYIAWNLKPQTVNKTENVTMDLSPWLLKPVNSKKEQFRTETWKLARTSKVENETGNRNDIFDLDGNAWVFYSYGNETVTVCPLNQKRRYSSDEASKMKWEDFEDLFPEYKYLNPNFSIDDDNVSYVKVKKEEFETLMSLKNSQNDAFIELQRLLN